jgi:hypothetical protein
VIPPNERKTLRALKENECRLPCGNHRRKEAVTDHSYCEFHMCRAFLPIRVNIDRTYDAPSPVNRNTKRPLISGTNGRRLAPLTSRCGVKWEAYGAR